MGPGHRPKFTGGFAGGQADRIMGTAFDAVPTEITIGVVIHCHRKFKHRTARRFIIALITIPCFAGFTGLFVGP